MGSSQTHAIQEETCVLVGLSRKNKPAWIHDRGSPNLKSAIKKIIQTQKFACTQNMMQIVYVSAEWSASWSLRTEMARLDLTY